MSVPPPLIERHRAGSRLVWVVPIAAAIVGLTLVINKIRETGPRVSISFQSGAGLEVGKTLLKYRDVTIGRVTRINLSEDKTHVEVQADLAKSASDLASEHTQFWVVRPRIGVGWASGLDTLLSGPYIGVEPGPDGSARTEFQGLEVPPPLAHRTAGRRIELQATDAGSLNVGAPVYFRHFQVGQVIDQQLDLHTGGARIVIFVDSPNDRFVTQATRFWNASGVDLRLGTDGLKLRTQSVATVVAGGIAFDRGPDDLNPAGELDVHVYQDESAAMASPDGEPHYVSMKFEKPMRGLVVGAPIEFVGVEIGNVTSIDVGYESDTQRFPVYVTGRLFPRRMGLAYTMLHANGEEGTDADLAKLAARLITRGLRVQARSGSLLTGRLYLALDFVPGAMRVRFDPLARPIQLPTVDSNLAELQAGIASTVRKINALPLERLIRDADLDLSTLHETLTGINADTIPGANAALGSLQDALAKLDRLVTDDSPLRSNVEQTLEEVQRTLSSVKGLAEYLDRHPEALLRGRARENSR